MLPAALGTAGGMVPVAQGEINVTIGQPVQLPPTDARRQRLDLGPAGTKRNRGVVVLGLLGFFLIAAAGVAVGLFVALRSGPASPSPLPPPPPPLPAGKVEKHSVVVKFTASGCTAHHTRYCTLLFCGPFPSPSQFVCEIASIAAVGAQR